MVRSDAVLSGGLYDPEADVTDIIEPDFLNQENEGQDNFDQEYLESLAVAQVQNDSSLSVAVHTHQQVASGTNAKKNQGFR